MLDRGDRLDRGARVDGFASRQGRANRSRAALLGLLAFSAACLVASPSRSFEAFDGKLQVHGFFESQFRAISANYSEDWDVTQWYQVANIEIEMDFLEDTVGIFDLISGFVRIEARFDCIYSRGCGMFRGINAFGNRAKSLPRRLSDGEQRTGTAAYPISNQLGNIGRFFPDSRVVDCVPDPNATELQGCLQQERYSGINTDPIPFSLTPGLRTLAGSRGTSGIQDAQLTATLESGGLMSPNPIVADDPFALYFAAFDAYRNTSIQTRGGGNYGLPAAVLGPWLPENKVFTLAGLADRPNPFDQDYDPASSGASAAQVIEQSAIAAAAYNASLYGAPIAPGNMSFLDVLAADGQAVARNQSSVNQQEFADLWVPFYNADAAAADAVVADAQQAGLDARGSSARYFRPIPIRDPGGFGAENGSARGVYLPSRNAREIIGSGRLDRLPFNINQSRRQWNRGESQKDVYPLAEAYLDVEMFDSRLWLRIGRQSIVWGKTELFRTTDQFNPVDTALASLPSLEESRIPLWSVRGVYSFYEVGPFEDVRAEVAFNFDEFQPNDLGACGEPYTVNDACVASFGALAHASAGAGVLGWDKPEAPWRSIQGWEVGGRLEWRWERFSFALSDFWGYNDLPFVDPVTLYDRNVDFQTGRPLAIGAAGPCQITSGGAVQADPIFAPAVSTPDAVAGTGYEISPGCLRPGPTRRAGTPVDMDRGVNIQNAGYANPNDPSFIRNNALDHHPANQQLFATICATTIGFAAALDPSACGLNIFNSSAFVLPGVPIPITTLASAILAGTLNGRLLLSQLPNLASQGVTFADIPLVDLNIDPADSLDFNCSDNTLTPGAGRPCNGPGTPGPGLGFPANSVSARLTAQQEALLGCGPFWGSNCDDSGIDLLNADASALVQSWIGFEREGGYSSNFTTRGLVDPSGSIISTPYQPGTVGFRGGPVATRYVPELSSHQALILPGGRGLRSIGGQAGIASIGYDPNVDGCSAQNAQCPTARNLFHPFSDSSDPNNLFENELAALSWNFLVFTVANDSFFDSQTEGGCNFETPQFCGGTRALLGTAGVLRNAVKAGGTERFGRRTFLWQSGGEALLRFDRRNVLGFSMDFAEDISKANFSTEFTWIPNQPTADNNAESGLTKVDELNLTVSVDRPTFINFLNPNRTFFLNMQWFFQYIDGYRDGMVRNGPWNVFFTALISTGYFQDRLLPSVTFVYDFMSISGAALPQITYRMTQNFSVTLGAALFMGRLQDRPLPIANVNTSTQQIGNQAYQTGVANGLAVVRDRDEVFFRLRYVF